MEKLKEVCDDVHIFEGNRGVGHSLLSENRFILEVSILEVLAEAVRPTCSG